ncbi:hypothetical protein MMC10_004296 [Thelotrema lepadinum]|nr:hypothetical protein [Thelotrema lepadinum]
MKLSLSFALALLGEALAHPSLAVKDDPYSAWAPAGPDDARAPCPMLNTLANHGFLNHNGKNITFDQLSKTFSTILNINESLAQILFEDALLTVPTPNATTLDLDDLNTHNILEHDGSLSRLDAYFGNNHVFDEYTFDQTKAYWTSETIDLQQAADARLARMYTSNATNPTFSISDTGTIFSFGETAAYILILGDASSLTVERDLVEYLFENEKLPTELGWSTRPIRLTTDGLLNGIQAVELATGGSFPYPVPSGNGSSVSSSETKRSIRSVGLHGGLGAAYVAGKKL